LLLFQTMRVLISLITFKFPSIPDSDVKQAIRRLSPFKCVGPDAIPGPVTEGCSQSFGPFFVSYF
jgi:hypothetical protein